MSTLEINGVSPQLVADPLADETIAHILKPWQLDAVNSDAKAVIEANAEQWRRLRLVSRMIQKWKTNADLDEWKAKGDDVPPEVAEALEHYVQTARALPDWHKPKQVEEAEDLFFDHGALSCVLLFCSSLPECYVIPDLATVLHISGELEAHAEYRIRSTAAMIFPVMMKGGLLSLEGSGIAQVLKVRLIHACIRHLILRGSPQQAVALLNSKADYSPVLPIEGLKSTDSMYEALFAHGWDVSKKGLPCNQEEMAYTLLTFNYVFLRSLRKLGIGCGRKAEAAYLHAWNVMGHVMGVQKELMPSTMKEAAALFKTMQARGRAEVSVSDVRPKLGKALMRTMKRVLPHGPLKHFPALMTYYLCDRQTTRSLRMKDEAGLVSRALFWTLMIIFRSIDIVGRVFSRRFSVSRLITRIMGYRFTAHVLMKETRALKLPEHLRNQVEGAIDCWSKDPKAPRWMNALETRFTKGSSWQAPLQGKAEQT